MKLSGLWPSVLNPCPLNFRQEWAMCFSQWITLLSVIESPSNSWVLPVRKLDEPSSCCSRWLLSFTLGSQAHWVVRGWRLPPACPPTSMSLLTLILTKWTFPKSSWIQTLSQDEIYYPLVQSYDKVLSEKCDESSDVLETHPESVRIFPLYLKMLNKLGALEVRVTHLDSKVPLLR